MLSNYIATRLNKSRTRKREFYNKNRNQKLDKVLKLSRLNINGIIKN